MSRNVTYIRPPLCACGQARAWRSSSEWLPFDGEACSDRCGMIAKHTIEALRNSAAWQRVTLELDADAVSALEQQSGAAIVKMVTDWESR
jgi:hypothetical protein